MKIFSLGCVCNFSTKDLPNFFFQELIISYSFRCCSCRPLYIPLFSVACWLPKHAGSLSWDRNQFFGQPSKKPNPGTYAPLFPLLPKEKQWLGCLLLISLSHGSLYTISGCQAVPTLLCFQWPPGTKLWQSGKAETSFLAAFWKCELLDVHSIFSPILP